MSPETGARLLTTLRQPGVGIARIQWSPGGDYIAAGARGGYLTAWSTRTGDAFFERRFKSYHVYNACWSPDERFLAATGDDGSIYLFDPFTNRELLKVKLPIVLARGQGASQRKTVMGLAWSPDNRYLAAGSMDCLRILNARTGDVDHSFGEQRELTGVAWSPDGKLIATTAYDSTICIWNAERRELVHRLKAGYHPALSWSPDSQALATSSGGAIVIVDPLTGRIQHVMEAYPKCVRALSFSADGKFLASRAGSWDGDADDNRLFVWDTANLRVVKVIDISCCRYIFTGLAFSPTGLLLATSAEEDSAVQVWELNPRRFRPVKTAVTSAYYKNAKVALLGDSGVGKSGLALVLTGHKFHATESTHGRRIWPLSTKRVRSQTGRSETRETVLWDLAGQPGYRLIHQLHLSDVTVGLILFDSRNELDPFGGVRYWSRTLAHAAGVSSESTRLLPKVLLVAARTDRGNLAVTRERILAVADELGAAAYSETSAKNGIGVPELKARIADAIDWDIVPTVSSSALFRDIKQFLLERGGCGTVLASVRDLLAAYIASLQPKSRARGQRQVSQFAFEGCIQRLQTLGLVKRFSFGDLVLLQPERLDAYASAIVLAAQQEPDGMGSIAENIVAAGRIPIPTEDRLANKEDERLLLKATVEDMVAHEIAFREAGEDGDILVFPSQLTRENPDLPDPPGKDLRVAFIGPVVNIYATLVVRLAHSSLFRLNRMWKNAVAFDSCAGGQCGVFLSQTGEGSGALTLFYEDAADETRRQFEDYVASHVRRRAAAQSVRFRRSLVCINPQCRAPISDIAVERRLKDGHSTVLCGACETRTPIVALDPPPPSAPTSAVVQIDLDADTRRDSEVALLSASGEMLTKQFRKWAGSGRATLAIVFTDVVGSTRLGEELGDEQMYFVRAAHFAAARGHIARFRGYEVKTIGDAFMVAFRTAVEALNFSLALQTQPGDPRLFVRAGIHVGPVRIEEEDAFGRMVNFAARVVGAISGAEIWVSDRAYCDIMSERASAHKNLTWSSQEGLPIKGFDGLHTLWRLDRP